WVRLSEIAEATLTAAAPPAFAASLGDARPCRPMPGPMSSLLMVRFVATGAAAAFTGVTVSALATDATVFGADRFGGGGGGGFGLSAFFFSPVTATEICFFLKSRLCCAEIRPTASPA